MRSPILPAVASLVLSEVLGRYHERLAHGELPGILEQFAPGGELVESRGATALHRGVDALRAFFTVVFSNGGGLGVEHCAVNDAGASCALEDVVTAWGRSAVPHQSAAAVFERTDTGLLSAVRMHDDVEHPLPRN